jgi:DNA polymerase-3 subunit epsilon
MLREIVLDTETTGLDAKGGDRLVELGCVEIVNRIPTGREFHAFIFPEDRPVHPDAERIHGLTNDFLKDKPPFRDVVAAFIEFIGDAPLVIHNAQFDVGFINAELARLKLPEIPQTRLVDTLALARRKHPAGPNSLDALCKRYGIDNTHRTKHGALVDSLLLATVYVELLGERQATLGLQGAGRAGANGPRQAARGSAARQRPAPLAARLGPADEAAHQQFVETLGEKAIWRKYVTRS